MDSLRVCVDAFNIGLKRGSGIATYGRNLLASFAQLGFETQILYGPRSLPVRDKLLQEIALFDAPPRPSLATSWLQAVDWVRPPFSRTALEIERKGTVITRQLAAQAPPSDRVWACQDVFHRANRAYATYRRFTPIRLGASGQRTDVMHWTCPLPLKAIGVANIYTFHDLVPLKLPFTTLDNKANYYSMCRNIIDVADQFLAVSESTKRDLVDIFRVPEERVTTTYQSVQLPEALLARADAEVEAEIGGVFGLGWRGYFIFFGGIEPKKNLPRLIEAYLGSGVDTPLVVVGGKSWLDEDETRLIYPDLVEVSAIRGRTIRRSDRIRLYDYLPMSLLVSLIRGAKATLFPSLYEGFGLPVLESMQLGTPVLTSNTGALPETAGEAAVLIDPYDTQAIGRAIRALDADDDLRHELARRGREQAAKFSPEAHRRRLADVYARLR